MTHSPLRCVVVLSAVTLVAYLVIGWLAYQRSGTDGLIAAAIAAFVCWLGATLALVMTSVVPSHPSNALSQLLLAIVFRTAIPFGAGVLLSASQGWLAQAGIFGLIVAFYLATLTTETLLSVNLINRAAEGTKAS